MNADALVKAIRRLAPPRKELLDNGLSNEDANAILDIYAVPVRRKPLSLRGESALHDLLKRFDTSNLELPTLTFFKPRVGPSETQFAEREGDLLVLNEMGVSVINHATLEREPVALSGDHFVRALLRLVSASRAREDWRGRFNELLRLLLKDAGVPETDSSIWRGAVHPEIAASSSPRKRTRGTSGRDR